MSSPDTRGTSTPKRHPACPGKKACQLPGCYHNAQSSGFSTNEISFDIYEVNGMLAAYPYVRFAGGLLYQRLSAASEFGTNVREFDDEPNANIGTMVYIAQTKIREVSGIVLDRIRSCLSTEMPV